MARTKFAVNKTISNVMTFANASRAVRKHKLDAKKTAVADPAKSTGTTRSTKPTKPSKHGSYNKAGKVQILAENTRVLYEAILYGTERIDHRAVAKALGIEAPAARMRHNRLMTKIAAILSTESQAVEELMRPMTARYQMRSVQFILKTKEYHYYEETMPSI